MSNNTVLMSDEAGKKPADFFTKLKNIFSFSGRTSRRKFWLLILIVSILNTLVTAMVLCVMPFALPTEKIFDPEIYIKVFWIIQLLFSLLILPATARRLHDTGKSALYLLWYLLPLLGSLILAIPLCYTADAEENKYGVPPAAGRTEGVVCASFGFIALVLSKLCNYAILCIIIFVVIFCDVWGSVLFGISQDKITNKICGSNLKNLGTAVCAYQEQYNRCMPDGKNSDGFRQLAQVNQGKELACTCDNGKAFAYVGSGLQDPDPRIPVVICISGIHPDKIHYIDANGKTRVVQVKKHPESYLEAVEEIEKNTIPMNFVDMITLTLTHWIYQFQLDQVRENAKLIDQAAQ